MLKAVHAGMHVKMVACFLQSSPVVIISLRQNGITEVHDLGGKSIALTPGDSLSQIFPALLRANNMSINDARVVSLEPAGKQSATAVGTSLNNQITLHWHLLW